MNKHAHFTDEEIAGWKYDPTRDPRVMHFVEEAFRSGIAVRELDPAKADYESQIGLILSGDYENPTRILRLDTVEPESSGDITEDVARDVVFRALSNGKSLTPGVFAFCKAHNSDLEDYAALRDGDLWTAEQLADAEPYHVIYAPGERAVPIGLKHGRAM